MTTSIRYPGTLELKVSDESNMKEMLKDEFMKVIEETRLILKDNNEWRGRYADYANKIQSNTPCISSIRSAFREWSPLKVYLNVTSAKGARNFVNFELRYMGQTVATLKGSKDKMHRLSTRGYDNPNSRDFGCNIPLADTDWGAENATKFRRFFRDRKGPRAASANKGNEEHRLESLLLTEFFKTKSKEKSLLGIQPVTIAKVRFPMPTPISASNPKTIKYSGMRGGGIDILTRTGTGGRATRLCIMELKDQNVKIEPPKAAMKRAIAYTVFVRELLRSDAGLPWWKLFGFSGTVPKQLRLYAACVMPSNENNDYSFDRLEPNIEKDSITLHYLYYLIDENDRIRIKPGDTTLEVK